MSLWQSLQHRLIDHRNEAQALRLLRQQRTPVLLSLISTRRTLRLAQRVLEQQTAWITDGPVARPYFGDRYAGQLKTPRGIVQGLVDASPAPSVIISFPDQLTGLGPSFETCRIGGADRRMSLLELMLLRRDQLRLITLPLGAVGSRYQLRVHAPGAQLDLAAIHADLNHSLTQAPTDWLAANAFKQNTAAGERGMRNRYFRDLEALARLLHLQQRDTPLALADTLAEFRQAA